MAATRPVTLGNTPLEAVYIPVGLTARQIVGAYLPAQWEDFVEEWGLSLKPPYVVIEHIGGPGDKGRDVIARLQDDLVAGQWDNYQCKHYDRPLMPSDIWGELAKLCFFTWNGTYPLPRRYRFVAPHDVGPKLQLLLTKPADLRREFIASWPSEGMKDLGAQLVKLDGDLRIYIEAFDFSIVGYQPVSEVLEQHRKTPHWHERFKQSLPPRPAPGALPDRPVAAESNYLAQLLRAYGHASGRDLTWSEVEGMQKFSAHLKRSRRAFFRAEELYRFSRELFPPGVFDRFKRQIHEGIIDVVDATHANGYECVVSATAAAQNLQLGNCELAPIVEVSDRHGACHHLANDGTITWVKS